jgi:hypothetical protein
VISGGTFFVRSLLLFSSSSADCFFNLREKNRRRDGLVVSFSSIDGEDSGLIFVFITDLRLCVDSDFERFKFFFEAFFDVLPPLLLSSSLTIIVSGNATYQ